MSHFTVTVVGEGVAEQLAPYHEFECTGVDDAYVKDVDITEDVKDRIAGGEAMEDALGYYGLEDRCVASPEDVDRGGAHKYGYAVVRDGELVTAVDRTNPSKKWDRWTVGGRWSGFFRLKPGATSGEYGERTGDSGSPDWADSALKGEIDFEGMREGRVAERLGRYRLFHSIVAGRPVPDWDEVRRKHGDDVAAARREYHGDPAIRDLKKDHEFTFEDLADYLIPEDQFARQARDSAVCTFAVVKGGQWYERGRMGWWATVSNEKAPGEWEREFSALIDALPDDTRLTIVDCHI